MEWFHVVQNKMECCEDGNEPSDSIRNREFVYRITISF